MFQRRKVRVARFDGDEVEREWRGIMVWSSLWWWGMTLMKEMVKKENVDMTLDSIGMEWI